MGKAWDKGKPYDKTLEWIRESYRVLKPGGHALVFAANRTQHRVFCAAEDVGFEYRDTVYWMYSSGFPKSADISKGIDKAKGAQRKKIRVEVPKASEGKTLASQAGRREGNAYSDDFNDHARLRTALKSSERERNAARLAGEDVPTQAGDEWDSWKKSSRLIDAAKKSGQRRSVGNPKSIRSGRGVEGGDRPFMQKAAEVGYHDIDSMDPVTEEAIKWQGWGTGLKPCVEPVGLFRKPCSEKSVVANVMRWGTGAMNLGECRVGSEVVEFEAKEFYSVNSMGFSGATPGGERVGRWPGNIILTHHPDCGERTFKTILGEQKGWQCTMDCAVALLDKQSGIKQGTGQPKVSKHVRGEGTQAEAGGMQTPGRVHEGVSDYGDSGGASRFFQVTSWSDREKEELRYFYSGKAARGDRSAGYRVDNSHATVKPVDLMRYLVRLITPKEGIVLDPFAGSGSTLVAAAAENFHYIGVEREATSAQIACDRLNIAAPTIMPSSSPIEGGVPGPVAAPSAAGPTSESSVDSESDLSDDDDNPFGPDDEIGVVSSDIDEMELDEGYK